MSVAPPSSFRDPFAPPSKPLPPPAPTPLRKRPIFWIAVSVAAIIVVAASAGLTILLWPKRAPTLPYEATRLPEGLRSVHRWKRDKKLPRQVVESEMAALCGGLDIVHVAMDTERPFANEIIADAMAQREETQKAIKCGIALAKGLGDTPRYLISLKDEKKTHFVDVYGFGLDVLPATGKNFVYSGGPKSLTSIACVLDVEKGTCPERATALARIPETTLWLGGRVGDSDIVAGAYKGRPADDQTRAMEELALRFESFDSVEIGTADSEYHFRALSALNDYSTDVEKAHTAFKKSMELGNAVFAFGESLSFHETDRDRLEITMKREEDATVVAKALKELRIALKHTKDLDIPATESRVRRKAHEAYVSMYRRAIGDAEVEQKGTTVILDMPLHAEPEEKTALLDREKDTEERTKRAIELYDALVKGKEPSEEVIQRVGGRDLAHAIADRKDGPPEHTDSKLPPIDVSIAKGFVLPGGTEPQGSSYIYKDAPPSLRDDILAGLRAAGWTVHMTGFGDGPVYECVKDEAVIEMSVRPEKRDVDVFVYSE